MKNDLLINLFDFAPKSSIKAGNGKETGRYPFFTSSNIKSLKIDNYLLDNEALIIGTGGLPSCNYYYGKFSYSTDNLVLVSKGKIKTKWLYYYLRNNNMNILEEGFHGAGLKHISKKYVSNIQIPLIEQSIQSTQTYNLDLLTNIIGKCKKTLIYYDELIKSRFNEMFENCLVDTDKQVPLNKCTKFIDYRGKTPEKSNSGIRLFTAKNVRMHCLNFEPAEFIPSNNYGLVMTRGIPKSGDLLFSTEAPLGNVCVIPELNEKFCVGQRLITIVPNEKLVSRYLEYYLSSDYFQEKVWRESSGSTVKGIKSKLLEKLPVSMPDYDKQVEFGKFVEQTDKSKFIVQNQIKLLQELLDKKMEEYFG